MTSQLSVASCLAVGEAIKVTHDFMPIDGEKEQLHVRVQCQDELRVEAVRIESGAFIWRDGSY